MKHFTSYTQALRALALALAPWLAATTVLAQAPAAERTWSHLLTATTPEASDFTSVSFGYQLAYGGTFAAGVHVGPSFRPEHTSSFAPLVWGHVAGASLQGAGDLGAGVYLGGYLRVDRTESGFAYQGFRQNSPPADPNVTVAGPRERARFRQTLGEVGVLLRWDEGGRWAVQGETGIAGGKRGVFTSTDLYPGFRLDPGSYFGTDLIRHNEYHEVWGLRSRLVVACRIGRLR